MVAPRDLVTKTQLKEIFGLSWPTVTKYTKRLNGFPKGSQRAKYNVYEFGEVFGYDKATVDELMKENL